MQARQSRRTLPRFPRAGLVATVIATVIACGGSSGATLAPTNGTTTDLLSVAGTYATAVAVAPGTNTCGAVTVQDNLTTIVLRPGDTTFALAHTSINADGVIQRSTAFTTIAATLAVNGSTYVITIKGTFTRTGFNAVVHLDVTQAVSPNRCAYDVNWVGSKNGSVNSLPVR